MRECHRCPTAEAIAQGKHNDTPWEKLPCSSCPTMDLDKAGRLNAPRALRGRMGAVRLTIDHDTNELIEADHQMRERSKREQMEMFVEPLSMLVNSLIALDDKSLLLVMHRLRGCSCLNTKAKELNITLANAHAKLKAAIQTFPWVGEAISIRGYNGPDVEDEDAEQLELGI